MNKRPRRNTAAAKLLEKQKKIEEQKWIFSEYTLYVWYDGYVKTYHLYPSRDDREAYFRRERVFYDSDLKSLFRSIQWNTGPTPSAKAAEEMCGWLKQE